MTPVRIGTRRSTLARTQARWLGDLLAARGLDVEYVDIVTEGDASRAPLTQIGGTGVFASAIRQALLEGRVDVTVHSLKDLPVAPEPGLVVAAIPPREEVRDVLVTRAAPAVGHPGDAEAPPDGDEGGLAALAPGARVGTGAPRRASQLRAHRDDLHVEPIRGNVETRLARLDDDLDAVVLAGAGLRRLGLLDGLLERGAALLDPAVMLPAPGQGALAVECREDDERVIGLVRELDDPTTRACVTAERALLAALEAGCTAPIGALARRTGDRLVLEAYAGSEDASIALRRSATGVPDDPLTLGRVLAAELLDAGAADIAPGVADAAPDGPPPHEADAPHDTASTENTQECPT